MDNDDSLASLYHGGGRMPVILSHSSAFICVSKLFPWCFLASHGGWQRFVEEIAH